VLPYEITVKTGDILNAGTDANVTLQLYGEDGKSEVVKLRSRTDNFERDAVEKFKVRFNLVLLLQALSNFIFACLFLQKSDCAVCYT